MEGMPMKGLLIRLEKACQTQTTLWDAKATKTAKGATKMRPDWATFF